MQMGGIDPVNCIVRVSHETLPCSSPILYVRLKPLEAWRGSVALLHVSFGW